MSRRKQIKPQQHISSEDFSSFSEDEPLGPAVDLSVRVCSRCCAEFNAPSDLEQHQRDCPPHPLVLILNEDEDLLSASDSFPASLPAGPEPSETLHDSEMENVDAAQHRSSRRAEVVGRFSSSSSAEYNADAVLCTSLYPESFPPPGCSADPEGYSWMKSNVIIEHLESTKVALAQLMHSDSRHRKTAIPSLLQQLLALQIQQIHQLQLIDQIRHQVLLFASHQAEIPETLVMYAKDLSASKSTNQLKALSTHLCQQLAAAAGLAKCLSAQAANIRDFKHFKATEQLNQSQSDDDVPSSSDSSQTLSKLTTTAVSKKQHLACGSSDPQLHFLSQTQMSSLMFSNNCFIRKTSENISEIVEDLDALAALAQQRKYKNLKLSAPTPSSKDSLFRCRFCTRVCGSVSALQIHLRSHAGEQPYRCNICGNRFSTRGNLKVHFQRHKEKHPHLQMNHYLVPKLLDNIQTTAGTPVRSSSPEKAAARWFGKSASPTTTTSGFLDSTNLPALIEKEDNLIPVPIPLPQGDLYFNSASSMDFRSKANPTKTSDSAETRQQRTMSVKSEDVKPSSNFKMMTTKSEELVDVVPNPFILPNCTSFSGFLSLRRSNDPKLWLPSVTSDKRASDPNECVVCHRILSCQSALRMHYRTHTGERPYQCKLCGRAFTTKGNLKTHQAVHRAAVPLRVQHSCPICRRKFTNAIVLQQHVHVHMEGHLSSDLMTQKHSADCQEGFRDKTKLTQRQNSSDDNKGSFCQRFKSFSFHLSPSAFGKNRIDDNTKTSYHEPHELQLTWIKAERPKGSTEECVQTKSPQAAESGQWTNTFPMSASELSLSPKGRAPMSFNAARLGEPFQTWLDSTTFTLHPSAAAPADLKLFQHTDDAASLIHNLGEKGFLKNTYCDQCGKTFACQSALDIHYRSHTKERPFVCTTCSRGFSTKGNLKQHMLTHQMRDFPSHLFVPSNPNQAPNHNSSMLSIGSRAVKTEMTAFLNSSFRSGKRLSSVSESPVAPPRRTAKQHHCKTCGKSFSSSSALQIHERTHTGERPFACAVCGRAFTTKGNLKVHMGTHMWNSAPSRRGCRLSVDRSPGGFGTRPVKLPELLQENPAMVSSSRESEHE